ncbi:phosphotransferase family protein, partial [Aspergillus thermomutatus]
QNKSLQVRNGLPKTMEERSWTQQAIDRFFKTRESPTQSECDDHARKISGASAVQEIAVPGSLSYTVRCINFPDERRDLVVSFRQPESTLDQAVIKLARSIHGALVPEATFHGKMPDSNPPLLVYTMPYLPGIPCLEALGSKAELSLEEEGRHICFAKHLARYFARCWLNPQPVDPEVQADCQDRVYHRLMKIKNSSPSILPCTTIIELERSLPILFRQTYPQVLTHNDLSQTNILINKETFEITGVVDWSLARVLPFGMELDTLLLATGYMDLSGWHNYTCRLQMLNAFWDEFWIQCQVYDDVHQREIRASAMQATKIGAVLHYAFQRNADGSPSEELTTSKWALKTLNALLLDQSL